MRQSLPKAGRHDVFEKLIEHLRERQAEGLQAYGRSLETHNGRNFLQDLFEEDLDRTVYFMGLLLQAESREHTEGMPCTPCLACQLRLGNEVSAI